MKIKHVLMIATTAVVLMSCMNVAYKENEPENTIRLIRNATLKMEYGGKIFLVDPILSEKGELMSVIGVNKNPTVHLTMPVKEVMDGVDFVLVTHSHFDHFDQPAATAMDDTLKLYIQPADSIFFLKEFGITNTEIIKDKITVEDITIHRTGGTHGKETIMEMMGEVSGFVLQAENQPTVYIVGDCLWTEEIKANIKRYQPDWIIINTGGAIIPALSSTFGTLIMNEKDVVSMIKESPSKCRFIAVHMDAIDHCQTTRSILRNEADKAGITKDKLMIPEDGEIILLNN